MEDTNAKTADTVTIQINCATAGIPISVLNVNYVTNVFHAPHVTAATSARNASTAPTAVFVMIAEAAITVLAASDYDKKSFISLMRRIQKKPILKKLRN